MNLSILIIVAIIASIAISYKTKVNMGFLSIAFAYIIGCFCLNIKTSDLIKMWPLKIFFVVLATSIFYNFAVVNGTLEKMSRNLLYKFRRIPILLPIALFLVTALIAALGAGYFTSIVLMAPIAYMVGKGTGIDPLIDEIAANYGSMVGASFMISPNGVIYRGLMNSDGYENMSFVYAAFIFTVSLVLSLLVIIGFIFNTKRKNKLKGNLEIHKPEPYTSKQKINLILIFLLVLIVLIPPILHIIAPKNAIITIINAKADIGLASIVFSVIASILKLGDEKQVIAKVPWNTLILVCGVGILISVAIKAGTIKMLASWVSSSMPVFIIPIAVCLIGTFMSFFASLIGVVIPALFPIIPIIASASGINPMLLFACVVIGAQASTISPFSTGGAVVISYAETEEERNAMVNKTLFRALPCCVIAAIIMSAVMTLFFL